jgi:hypothetical protein
MNMPTTAAELQMLLERRELYPWHAAANGSEPYDGYCLRRDGSKWVVYRTGPLVMPKDEYFEIEADAVVNLIQRMKGDAFASHLGDL